MPFGDIFGQERAITYLTRSLAAGRVAHAYLFAGPDGVGKKRTALTLAQALNCPEKPGDPCGVCSPCRRIWGGTHPDVKLIVPEGNTIKIAQIRALQGEVYYRPLEGRYKVYILAEAHKMTEEAANCFLRVLEEPPAYIVFILLTEQPANLLPTVVSRCQLLPFYEFPLNLIREKLESELGLAPDQAAVVAAMAGGSWGRARELAESDLPQLIRERVLEIVTTLCHKDQARRWQLAAELEKEDLTLLLEQLLYWYRDLLVLKETGIKELLINRDQAEYLEEAAQKYSRRGLLGALGAIQETLKLLAENVNIRLALDVLLGRLEPDCSP